MTCIAALVHEGRIYMGGDSAATGWYLNQTIITESKVFPNAKMVIGVCGSIRTLQLLRYSLTPPVFHSDEDPYKYMVTTFMDAVRSTLKHAGVAIRRDEVESIDSEFLVGFRGRLFRVMSDYGITESADNYAAVGSGREFALGALFTTAGADLSPHQRIIGALEAAEKFNAGVRRPFHIEVLEAEPGKAA